MLKRLASSVKSAIQSNKPGDNNETAKSNKNLNSIRDRITIEKEIERKNQRLKLITDCRLNNVNKAANSETKQANVPAESKLKRTTSDLSLNFSANESIASTNNPNLDRRKRLELWRKDRKDRMLSLKDTQKPVFKVQHCGSKFFDSKSTGDLKSANVTRNSSMLDSSKSGYKFHDSIKHTTDTHKMSRQNSIQNLHENEKYHFGNASSHGKFVPQFTFSMKVNSSDLSAHHSTKSSMTVSTPLLTAPKTSSLRRHESIGREATNKKVETNSKLKRAASTASETRHVKVADHSKQPLKKETPTLKSTNAETSGPVTRSKLAELKSKELIKTTDKSNLPPVQRHPLKSSKSSVNEDSKQHLKTRATPSAEPKTDDSKKHTFKMKQPVSSSPLVVSQHKINTPKANVNVRTHENENDIVLLPSAVIAAQSKKADMSFEDMTVNKKQDTVDHVIVRKSVHNLSKELISTPKHSRQKEELENEFKNLSLSVKKTIKHFEDLSNSFSCQIAAETEQSVKHFRSLVESKTRELFDLSQTWTNLCNKDAELIPDGIQGDIRSACGLAKLLMDERFDQFSELIDQCEATSFRNPDPDVKVVKCSDLQGFWEMINHQVKDVENQFRKLEKIKENNWSDEFEPVQRAKKTAVRKQAAKTAAATTAPAKTAAKSKFAEFRAQLLKSKKAAESGEAVSEGVVEQEVNKEHENPVEMKPTTPEEQKTVQKAKKRSVIRSRPSDLIKFDSPVPMKRNNLKDVIVENSEDEATNKENDPFDFDTYVPIVWSKNAKTNQSPLTPNRRSQLNNLVNSPLLKLALVSSHGKTRKSQLF